MALVFCVCSTCVCVAYKLLAIGGFVYVCTCVSVFFCLLVFPLVFVLDWKHEILLMISSGVK